MGKSRTTKELKAKLMELRQLLKSETFLKTEEFRLTESIGAIQHEIYQREHTDVWAWMHNTESGDLIFDV